MELITQIHQFIEQPFPLWETTLTHQLVQHQWEEVKGKGFASPDDYSTARVWLNEPSLKPDKRRSVSEKSLCLEMPSPLLQSFYDEHGLELLTENEIEVSKVLPKINKALSVLQLNESVYTCICDLVQSIHILKQPDKEIDLSYSHPKIPFSIFVSVCDDDSVISNLRVAESILHEAMHLKLTLIENIVPLVKHNANGLFFSPWRNEERPVQGVLHGLFVFRAIYDFYNKFLKKEILSEANKYSLNRMGKVQDEVNQIKDLPSNRSLTLEGANLSKGLLP